MKTTTRRTRGSFATREDWLHAAIERVFRPWFEELGIEVPAYQIAMGYGQRYRAGVLAQCYVRALSEGVNSIYVTPETVDAVDILDSVLHELIHATDDCQSGHRGYFAETAKALGFESPYTSTPLTPELRETLTKLAADLGPLPHAKVTSIKNFVAGGGAGTVATTPSGGVKVTAGGGTQKNRHRKVKCATDDAYFVRMSRKMIDDHGAPLCPCHGDTMVEEV